jgi:exodeoxyribonuclease VII large subunit
MVVPDRADWLAAFRRAADRTAAAVGRTLEAARRELAAERRALDRLDPRAQLASDRERVGLLLDRAVRAADTGMGRRRAILDTVAETIARPVIARIGSARATLDATRSALAVLDPQSTLDRGYAIVRRTIDGAIVRDTADAPAGTPLAIRVARGELPATVDRS